MVSKKLEDSELKELFNIIQEYQDIFQQINDIENQIKKLNDLQQELSKKLELNRQKEKLFTEAIIKKYGEGQFDFVTLEYKVK